MIDIIEHVEFKELGITNQLFLKLDLAKKSLDYITHLHVITPHEKGSLETCAGCVAMRALMELGKL